MKKFDKRFLSEVLGQSEEEIKLVMKAQNLFPELLVNEGNKIESAKKLYDEIGLDKSQWARWYKKNIIENEFFLESKDWEVLDTESTTEKGGQVGKDFIITIDFTKHLAMMAKTKNSHDFRNYFILMEKSIKGKQDHLSIREPEKLGYNKMKDAIIADYESKHSKVTDFDRNYLMIRESNMINENLIGYKANEIKDKLGYIDIETREHLKISQNTAIEFIQSMITGLVIAGMDFETRANIVNNLCKNKYSDLRMDKKLVAI